MNVRGTAFIARKQSIVAAFGEARWKAAIERADPSFRQLVFPTSALPADKFLALQDQLLGEFFQSDPSAYWDIGVKSAEWALTQGPYKAYLGTKDIRRFAEVSLKTLWETYFSEGRVETRFEGNVVHAYIHELPIWHVYFEYVVMGYAKKALEMLTGGSVRHERVKGVAEGQGYYRVEIGSA